MLRRRREPPKRDLTIWKTAVLFLASGTWLAGAISGRPAVTGAAIVLLVVGLGLILAERV